LRREGAEKYMEGVMIPGQFNTLLQWVFRIWFWEDLNWWKWIFWKWLFRGVGRAEIFMFSNQGFFVLYAGNCCLAFLGVFRTYKSFFGRFLHSSKRFGAFLGVFRTLVIVLEHFCTL
jgi:hypothetical protein